MSAIATYSPFEIGSALTGAALIQAGFLTLLVVAGAGRTKIDAVQEKAEREVPIAVQPVLDDAPLMKLGGKKKVRAKLPDMWTKQAPVLVPESAELSAPTPKAKDDPAAIPTSAVATGDAQAPPPDAQVTDAQAVVADAAAVPDSSGAPAESEVVGEGDPSGVKEGTTTDPLQANWKKTYHVRILSWFNARFRPPVAEVPCEELKNLTAGVTANVSPDRTVTGYSMGKASGNAVFDQRVRSAMDGMVGQQLPPPPPLCTDCNVPAAVSVTFSGRTNQCK
ncbi:MAG: TonB C-terminal domain-containing protein [Polyangiaceae bacterium]|nr:TonB C-terminal domain-containing protein [Polyangiaceae bacterium]